MKDFKVALVTALRSDPALMALLGNVPGKVRMRDSEVVEDPPAVTISEITGTRATDHGRDEVIYQVDCWGGRTLAGGLEQAEGLADAVEHALHMRALSTTAHANASARLTAWRDIPGDDFAAVSCDYRVVGFALGKL